MDQAGLRNIVDFILNKASDSEFEVIVKACERRRKDNSMFKKIGGVNPEKLAKGMAHDINQSMGASMDSLNTMVKGFVEDIIRKNAPEITEDQLHTLLEEYVPSQAAKKERAVKMNKKSAIPSDVLVSMIRNFVKHALGQMAPSEQKALWDEMPRWYENYWASFTPDIKLLIDAYLNDKLDEAMFWKAVYSVLEL